MRRGKGGQAAAQLSRLPGPRRRCPHPHPRVRRARLSRTLAAEIHLSVQGQDRNCRLSLANRKFLIDKVLRAPLASHLPPPNPGAQHSFKTKPNPSASSRRVHSASMASASPAP